MSPKHMIFCLHICNCTYTSAQKQPKRLTTQVSGSQEEQSQIIHSHSILLFLLDRDGEYLVL